ncbi:hypothetical protein BJX68DRAFT_82701 [Aspergillus pseudodeflectus]|uniref:Uncharacterized protein n=1 Tax=Aspergillus pseudodeflectus TaxID=176178 RepID=A0ABR4L705_9EURO
MTILPSDTGYLWRDFSFAFSFLSNVYSNWHGHLYLRYGVLVVDIVLVRFVFLPTADHSNRPSSVWTWANECLWRR